MDRDTDSAATPSAAFRYLSPGRVCEDFTLPADSFWPGQTPAQDASRPGVSNTVISPPVSAMITSATVTEMPGIVVSASRAARKGEIASSIRAVSRSIMPVAVSIWVRYSLTRNA